MSRRNKYNNKSNGILDYLGYIATIFLCIGAVVYLMYSLQFKDDDYFATLNTTTSNKPLVENTTTKNEDPTTEDTTTKEPVTINPVRPSVNLPIDENTYFVLSEANIRSAATTNSAAIGSLKKYDYVQVVKIEGNWAQIDRFGTTAYVYASLISNDEAFKKEAIAIIQEEADDKLNCSNIVDKTTDLYTYKNLTEDLIALREKYPDYFTYKSFDTTVDGREIYLATVGNTNAEKKILVHAGIYANEYFGTLLTMSQIEYYLDNYNYYYNGTTTYKELFEEYCLYFIPSINPDGAAIAQFGLNGIKTDSVRESLASILTSDTKAKKWLHNANNVNLYRNFKTSEVAVTQIESRVLYELVTTLSNIKACIVYSTGSDSIHYDFGASDLGTAQKDLIQTIGATLSNHTGYKLAKKAAADNYGRFMNVGMNIPTFIIEVSKEASPVPITVFSDVWKANKLLLPALIESLR